MELGEFTKVAGKMEMELRTWRRPFPQELRDKWEELRTLITTKFGFDPLPSHAQEKVPTEVITIHNEMCDLAQLHFVGYIPTRLM
jgi:hypothetical protein